MQLAACSGSACRATAASRKRCLCRCGGALGPNEWTHCMRASGSSIKFLVLLFLHGLFRLQEDPSATTVLRHHITTCGPGLGPQGQAAGRLVSGEVEHTIQCWADAWRWCWDGWPRAPQGCACNGELDRDRQGSPPTSRPPRGRGATHCGQCAESSEADKVANEVLRCLEFRRRGTQRPQRR